MKHNEFNDRAATVLGGYGWKTRLARVTGNNYATVKRWTYGESPVPGAVIALVECLEQMRDLGVPYPPRFEPVERRPRQKRPAAGPAAKRRRVRPSRSSAPSCDRQSPSPRAGLQ